MKRSLFVGGGLLAIGAITGAQTSVVHFSEPSGLSARAKFELVNAGNTLVVTLCNTSTALPPGFTSVDQLLSSLSFDLGAPGVNPSDPAIANGFVRTGSSSASLNFSLTPVGPDTDVSGEYGYGNAGAPGLLPNFVTSRDLGGVPFGPENLDGDPALAGPEAGLVPAVLALALNGEGAIQDEIVLELNLDQTLPDLSFLADGGVQVGFGTDVATLTNDCDHDSYSVVTPDAGGLNAPNSLFPMGIPSIGNPSYQVCMDDAADACGITPGTLTIVAFSPATASILLPGFGCQPGSAGELMIDLTIPHMLLGPLVWAGPGSPACHPMPIPPDESLCRTICYGQGVWIDKRGPSGPFILTNRLDFVIGI